MGTLSARPFAKLLVANRGEIAVRVIRTAQALGYETVAVYSDADRDAPHVQLADEALRLGPAPVADSYLHVERVLEALARSGADAVHPGYGFLSENAAFAHAVIDAGAVWVGPPPHAIEAMGDKARAKARMRDAGVPCVPGFDGDAPDDEALIAAAGEVGYPLLVKASAGGGGRGMRRVDSPQGLPDALRSARAESANAFGDDTLLLERLVEGARHVEVQVMADAHGTTLHLGERDCSVQRRHQKVVEEAPSPAVDPALRSAMGQAACAAAAAVGYVGAGTVEFLLGADGAFYFLEMNTRLQVEHPVTEEVYDVDLVALQLSVASGEPLPFAQADLAPRGHAIEVRLYAENPAAGYLPQPGPVHLWQPPRRIRVDAGLPTRGQIHAAYDPMVAKLIARGPSREVARRRLLRALDDTVFFGVPTNRGLLRRVLQHATFVAGEATTGFLDGHPELAAEPEADAAHVLVGAALWLAAHGHPATPAVPLGFRPAHGIAQALELVIDGEARLLAVSRGEGGVHLTCAEHSATVDVRGGLPRLRVALDGHERSAHAHALGDELLFTWCGRTHRVAPARHGTDAAEAAGDGAVCMPMSGQVLALDVAPGDRVTRGQVVATVEAMKLETPLKASVDGTVVSVHATAGQALPTGAVVVAIEPSDPQEAS